MYGSWLKIRALSLILPGSWAGTARDRRGAARRSAGAFLDAGVQQADNLGDALGAYLGPAFGSVEPFQIRLAVELSQRVEERACGRIRLQRRGHIRIQVAPLRSLGQQLHLDRLRRVHGAVAQPDR